MKAILIASSYEYNTIIDFFDNKNIKEYTYGRFFEQTINDNQVIFFKIGVGKTLSSASTQFIIDKFKPDLIYLIGTCAATNNKHKLLEIVTPTETCEYDLSYEEICFYSTDISLKTFNLNYKTGCIATSDTPLTNYKNAEILKNNNVDFVDMESASVSKICELNNTNHCIIKGISDLPFLNNDDKYNWDIFQQNAPIIINKILNILINIIK